MNEREIRLNDAGGRRRGAERPAPSSIPPLLFSVTSSRRVDLHSVRGTKIQPIGPGIYRIQLTMAGGSKELVPNAPESVVERLNACLDRLSAPLGTWREAPIVPEDASTPVLTSNLASDSLALKPAENRPDAPENGGAPPSGDFDAGSAQVAQLVEDSAAPAPVASVVPSSNRWDLLAGRMAKGGTDLARLQLEALRQRGMVVGIRDGLTDKAWFLLNRLALRKRIKDAVGQSDEGHQGDEGGEPSGAGAEA